MILFPRLLAVVLMALPALLAAAEPVTAAAAPDPLAGGYLVKLTLSLLGVLAFLFVLVAVLKRVGGLPRAARQQSITVQGSLAVGPRERVVWIEVEGHQLVLGVTSGKIEPLLHLPPEAVRDAGGSEPADALMTPSAEKSAGFGQALADVALRSER